VRILAIATASGPCAAALVDGDTMLAQGRAPAGQGMAAQIPGMLTDVLTRGGPAEAVAVVVGPGSFTGLRAGISVATGLALAAGIPLVGVTVSEALADSLPHLGGRVLWVATAARRGHVHIDIAGGLGSYALNTLPASAGRVAVAGDAANAVASVLAARGADVMLTSARHAMPRHVAAMAERRLRGELPPCPPLPLYSEPPRVTAAAAGPRPPPLA
jgi:tRNA threonylcarbamoyl adenosine modification protein YeaZ